MMGLVAAPNRQGNRRHQPRLPSPIPSRPLSPLDRSGPVFEAVPCKSRRCSEGRSVFPDARSSHSAALAASPIGPPLALRSPLGPDLSTANGDDGRPHCRCRRTVSHAGLAQPGGACRRPLFVAYTLVPLRAVFLRPVGRLERMTLTPPPCPLAVLPRSQPRHLGHC
jgi:hypothetical protein